MSSNGNDGKVMRLMFLAWGESIHARRRIRIFTEDPSFDVAVVSTFDYHFENARNYLLSDAGHNKRSLIGFFFDTLNRITDENIRITDENILRNLLESIWKSLKDLRILKRAVKDFQPDVIFLQTLLYPCYLTYFLPKEIPVIITFWNGDVTWWAKWNGLERLLKKRIVVYGVQHSAAMTVNSQSAFDACLNYGASPEKIHLIRYPGVDLEHFKPASREEAKRRLGIDAGKVVLCPRGIGGYLNSDIIIEAAAAVIAKIPEVVFIFISGVGDDAEWQRHLEKATQLGISGRLQRHGLIPWESMPLYYQASDVVVSISSKDSLPNCMMESMACGIPVVMGDIPQIRDWVTDGVNGLLTPPRDPESLAKALLRLLDDNGVLVNAFNKYNFDLVCREFDSRVNSPLVKQLVYDVGERHAQKG